MYFTMFHPTKQLMICYYIFTTLGTSLVLDFRLQEESNITTYNQLLHNSLIC